MKNLKYRIPNVELVIILLMISFSSYAQNKYGLKTTTLPECKASLKQSPEKELVNLETFIPDIKLEIRYATTSNFTGEKSYNLSRAYAWKPVA